jgi:hypothetical protein
MAIPERAPEHSKAYLDGFRSGTLDARLNRRCDYAWQSTNSTNDYTREYSYGYRAGQVEELKRRGEYCR